MFHQSTCVVVDGVRADTEQQAAHRSRFNGGTNDRFEAGLRILEEACMNGLLFLGTPRRVGAAGKYEECGTDEYSQPGFEDMFDGKYHELEECSDIIVHNPKATPQVEPPNEYRVPVHTHLETDLLGMTTPLPALRLPAIGDLLYGFEGSSTTGKGLAEMATGGKLRSNGSADWDTSPVLGDATAGDIFGDGILVKSLDKVGLEQFLREFDLVGPLSQHNVLEHWDNPGETRQLDSHLDQDGLPMLSRFQDDRQHATPGYEESHPHTRTRRLCELMSLVFVLTVAWAAYERLPVDVQHVALVMAVTIIVLALLRGVIGAICRDGDMRQRPREEEALVGHRGEKGQFI